MSHRCSATTSNGYGCINPAQPGRTVCAAHDSSRQCGAPTRNGGRCKRMRMEGQPACSKHLS